ncbi:MAG TPA: hypothetical protein VGH87_09585 [Polyangiaceae bacterium]
MRCHESAVAIGLALALVTPRASAQACCAGAAVATPGRLGPHDFVLVGADVRAAAVVGSYGDDGKFTPRAPGTVEDDLEQDVFAAIRVLRRGQLALFVPFIETLRRAGTLTDVGGGLGDVNVSARWDFYYAGQSRVLPGVAMLAGVTFPTGIPIESAGDPLGANATGVGAFQFNGGLALEQTFGPWLVALSGIIAARTSRTVGAISETLAPQISALATLAYTTRAEIAFALSSAVTYEGDATINGADAASTERLTLTISTGASIPLGDTWRAQVGASVVGPFVGENTLTSVGLQWTLVHTWF